jgi:predicted DsbA family dithiol-disulfide isomerase
VHDNILSVAVGAGLVADQVKKVLDDYQAKLDVAASEKEVYKLGISGVPFYIINNAYGISGAQMSDTFVKAFEDIGEKMVETGGEACDVDGKNC